MKFKVIFRGGKEITIESNDDLLAMVKAARTAHANSTTIEGPEMLLVVAEIAAIFKDRL